MNKPIDELITYADHTQGCMVAAGHDERTCGYDDAEGKAQAAWDALKAENARLREVLENVRHGTVCPAQVGWLDAGPCTCGLAAALSPQEKGDE